MSTKTRHEEFVHWLTLAPEGPATTIAQKMTTFEHMNEDEMGTLELMYFHTGIPVAVVTVCFDIYTNSMGGGSQTLDFRGVSKEVEHKIRSIYQTEGLLPNSTLPLPRRFDRVKLLETRVPHMLARGEIHDEDGSRNGNGGIILKATFIFDLDGLEHFEPCELNCSECPTSATFPSLDIAYEKGWFVNETCHCPDHAFALDETPKKKRKR